MLSTRNLKAGDVLDGRYRLERRVGGGGMGDVWEGTDTILWRTVAVKILLADLVDDRGFRERFRREARAIAVMKGPGVVEVYDYGEIDDGDAVVAYLIMEFVDGKPLSRLLGLWGKLGAADTLRVIGGVAEALQVAHGAGIVHRDIKPGNILVRNDGSVVLVDFGIARAGHNLTLTTTGVVLGTVTYMSPEQAAGENLTASSDLYSLGVVAHQCLAGSPPFKADTPLGVLSAHLRNPPPALPPEVPREVDAIVTRALAKEPSDRWPDAAAFAAACRETRALITAVKPPAPPAARSSEGAPLNAPEARTGPPAGPRAGAHREPPTTPDTMPDLEDEERPRGRRRLWAAFTGSLVVLGTAGALAAASPWHSTAAPGIATTTEDADSHGQASGDAAAPSGEDGALPAPGGEADEADMTTATEEPSDGRTSPLPSEGEPTGGPSSSSSPTSSTSPTPEPKATVPEVEGLSESAARQRIEEAGLTPNVTGTGTGDHECGVVRQRPSAGTEVDLDSTVQVTVRKAEDAEGCKTESGETETPGGR